MPSDPILNIGKGRGNRQSAARIFGLPQRYASSFSLSVRGFKSFGDIKNSPFNSLKNQLRKRGVRGRTATEINLLQVPQQILQMCEAIASQALSLTAVMAYRSQKIFQDSFVHKRFNSADGRPWKPLSGFTISYRRKGGGVRQGVGYSSNPSDILNYTGDLKRSITVREKTNGVRGYTVFTDPNAFVSHNDKRSGFCYAAIHNNAGEDGRNYTYGNGFGGKIRPKKVVQRQFMGHSTYLDEFFMQNVDRYMRVGVLG
mgnify:CR=1 FL=1